MSTKEQAPVPRSQEEKRRSHRRRARLRMLWRLLAFVLVVALVVLLWQNWQVLNPEHLMDTFQGFMGSGIGSYPVDVAGSGIQKLTRSQNYTVVLGDSYLTYLDSSGAQANRYACTYPSALLSQAGRYTLAAELGGRRLQLNTRTGTLTEMQVPQDILAVSVNEQGRFAVLMQGPQGYAVQMKVYDKQGNELYSRSRNQAATQIALSQDGRQVAVLSMEAADGQLNTFVEVFSPETDAKEALCSYEGKDTLLYELAYLADNWLAAVGENGVVMLDTKDGLASVYTTAGMRLLGFAPSGDTLALALRPYGSTAGGVVQVVDKQGDRLCEVPFEGEYRHLSSQDGFYALLTDSRVSKIGSAGYVAGAAVPADGQQAVLDGNKAVVLGLTTLTAYDLT